MTHTKIPARRARGFSLVELLIATLIGLLLLAGVGSVFVGSKTAFRSQEGMGQVQESGRFLSYLMYPHIRQAGYLPDPKSQLDPAIHFRGPWRQISGAEGDVGFFDAAVLSGVAGARAGTDAILVTYAGQANSPLATCRGGTVGADQFAANVFYVSTPDASGLSSLNCASLISPDPPPPGGGPTGVDLVSPDTPIPFANPQPLISGVQDMQIQYGVDTVPGDDQGDLTQPPPLTPGLFPNQYFDADDVPDWTRVVAVRIQITTVSSDQTEGADVGGGTATLDDDFVEGRRLQRVFTTTLSLRNSFRA